MSKEHQIFAVFILITIIFVVYWLMSGFLGNSLSSEGGSPITINNSAQDSSSAPYINSIQSSLSQSQQNSTSTNIVAPSNLTDQISNSVASQFLSKINLTNSTSSQSLVDQINSASSSVDVNKLMDQFKNNPLGMISSIATSSILITNNDDLQSIQNYGQQYSIIFTQAANTFISDPQQISKIVTDAVNNGNTQQLDQLISDFNSGYDKLIGLRVPSSLVMFHEKSLIFLKNSAIVFGAIRNGDNDPIKAYIASTDGATEITSESQELVVLYDSIIKQYNLNK